MSYVRDFLVLFSVFVRQGFSYRKHKFFRLSNRNPAPTLVQIGQKSEKLLWRHYYPTWGERQTFWHFFVSLIKLSYFSKFHVNIITGSGIMTVFFYKGLTRNPEIGIIPVWVFPNIWRLEWVMDTKFGTNVSNKKLLNAAKFQGYTFYRFWIIKGKPAGGEGG